MKNSSQAYKTKKPRRSGCVGVLKNKGEYMQFLEFLVNVLLAIGTFWTLAYAYKAIFFIIGLFHYKKFKPTENKHKYAICVPARNEEKVIKNFLESVKNQDYPLEKITVFVIANNCTDSTAQVARDFDAGKLNVVVYERDNEQERTKGFALKYLFEQIQKDYGIEAFDGYYIFDADNVIMQDYLTKMNEAFDEGNKIITSFRNSKNINRNWISFGYAMHWMRTCLTENRGKGVLNQACRIQGTGYLFANELVKNGWTETSLTEDRSFCSKAVVQNYRITYCDEAVFFDEQPYTLKVAFRQRLRWAKGNLQCALKNCPKLLRNMFDRKKTFTTSYDYFFLNFPRHIEAGARRIVRYILQLVIAIHTAEIAGWFWGITVGYLSGRILPWIGQMLIEVAVFIKYGKRIEKGKLLPTLFHVLMFPFFDVIGKWSMYIAVFKKVEWKPIPHDTVMDVEKLKKQDTQNFSKKS